jgi:hypothetical protein
MADDETIQNLAHTIQLSVAPVFLLSGVGAFLGVLTNRLSRVVDRMRALEEGRGGPAGPGRDALTDAELATLRVRARIINRAISLCTFSALLVAGTVAALFLSVFVHVNASVPIAATFVAAMLSLMSGLVLFLREVHLAIRFMRDLTAGRSRGTV